MTSIVALTRRLLSPTRRTRSRTTGIRAACQCVGVRWKPIVWNEADHYPQWVSCSPREGNLPLQGSRLTLAELPGRTFVVTTVEADAGLVWLKPVGDLDSY